MQEGRGTVSALEQSIRILNYCGKSGTRICSISVLRLYLASKLLMATFSLRAERGLDKRDNTSRWSFHRWDKSAPNHCRIPAWEGRDDKKNVRRLAWRVSWKASCIPNNWAIWGQARSVLVLISFIIAKCLHSTPLIHLQSNILICMLSWASVLFIAYYALSLIWRDNLRTARRRKKLSTATIPT